MGSDDVEAKVENLITKAKAVKKSKELTPIQLVDRAVQVFLFCLVYYRLSNGGSINERIMMSIGQLFSIMV